MAQNIVDLSLFYELFGKSKFDKNKDYSNETLTKMSKKEGKEMIKTLLIFDLAYGKLTDYYYSLCDKEENLFKKNSLDLILAENTKNVWLDYFIVSQNKLKEQISLIDKKIEELNKKNSIKAINLRTKFYEFKAVLTTLININASNIKKLSYERYVNKSEEISQKLVQIANVYRHIKEYCRVKMMFMSKDTTSGMKKNRENIFTLLNELATSDFHEFKQTKISQYANQEVNNSEQKLEMEVSFTNEYGNLIQLQKLYNAVLKEQEYLTNKDYKINKKQIEKVEIQDILSDMDNSYLKKIKLVEDYLTQLYEYWIRYAEKQEKPKGINKIENIEKYPFLSQHPIIYKKYINFFKTLDLQFNKYKIIDDKFFEFLKVDDLQDNKFAYFLQVFRDNYNKAIPELTNRNYYDDQIVPFVKAQDPLSYTTQDIHNNTAKITEFDNPEEIKNTQGGINKLLLNENQKDEIEETKLKENLEEISLDEKISSYFKDLIGLDEVKETLLEIISKKILQGENYKQGKMHMAFLGNPGTGKTTVARILGKILYENKLIDSDKVVEVKFSDLYQRYVGASAQETANKILQAEGGILFIDEAHQFYSEKSGNDFRDEIINTLIPALENNDKLLVIFAGYSSEMMDMLNGSDRGLFSRVNHKITFKDFSKEEIMNLFDIELKNRKNRNNESFVVDDKAREFVSDYFDILMKVRKNNFANGREVRIVVEKILNKFAVMSLKRENISEINASTMKQILSSETFKNNLKDGNNQSDVEENWLKFENKLNAYEIETSIVENVEINSKIKNLDIVENAL